MLNECRNCNCKAEFYAPKGGGNGVRCNGCGSQLHHPNYTKEQMERVWNWRNSDKFKED